MRSILIVACLTLFTLSAASTTALAETDEARAVEAAETFLHLMDNGDYEQGFASMYTVNQELWIKEWWIKLNGGRRHYFGPLINRAPRSVKEKDGLYGYPDGHYFSINYESSFQNKRHSNERIEVVYEDGRGWVVAEYFVN